MAASAAPAPASQQALAAEPIATGLSWQDRLTQVTFAPGDDASRVFLLLQTGQIRILLNDVLLPAPFLDVSAKLTSAGNEQGLLGLAFHPDYRQNGYFYVNYTDNSGGDTVIERYSVDPNDPDKALSGSGLVLIEIDQPYSNHNGGWIDFGPDGYLYVGMGDGGDAGDPGNRAQSGGSLLGKMLRLDVDNPAPGLNYGIPPSNPFVGDPNVLDEIWAIGMRNPWRNDFDNLTGDLWITDVGQSAWEEINFEPAGTGGRNYGWRTMEGMHCFSPPTGCNQSGLTLPVYESAYGGSPYRCALIGGVLYRGRQMANMHARFFFSDFCSQQTWSFRQSGGGVSDFVDHTAELLRPNGQNLGSIRSLGENADGEIYVVTQNGSEIYRVVPRGLRLRMPRLMAGSNVAVPVTGGTAGGITGLFFSLNGLGATVIPQAQVTLGIRNAQLIGAVTANGAGAATFSGLVPSSLQNRTLWLQAAQVGVQSNIAIATVD